MGRQIRFYATEEDCIFIITKAYVNGWYIIDDFGNPLSLDDSCEQIRKYFLGEVGFFVNYLAHKNSKIVFLENGKHIDPICSEVIEFFPSMRNPDCKNVFSHGRLWYDKTYYDLRVPEAKLVKKAEELTKMFDCLVKEIKKVALYSKEEMCYIMPDAYALYKEGLYIPREGRVDVVFHLFCIIFYFFSV